jgi:hypothetical protein
MQLDSTMCFTICGKCWKNTSNCRCFHCSTCANEPCICGVVDHPEVAYAKAMFDVANHIYGKDVALEHYKNMSIAQAELKDVILRIAKTMSMNAAGVEAIFKCMCKCPQCTRSDVCICPSCDTPMSFERELPLMQPRVPTGRIRPTRMTLLWIRRSKSGRKSIRVLLWRSAKSRRHGSLITRSIPFVLSRQQ